MRLRQESLCYYGYWFADKVFTVTAVHQDAPDAPRTFDLDGMDTGIEAHELELANVTGPSGRKSRSK